MAEKKRHHYIPITYLANFADGGGRVFAYRKDAPATPLHVRPSEIAFERYYYSQPLPEGGRDNNWIEDAFSAIESTWPPLREALLAQSTAIDVEELFIFLALMRVRVPATRDLVETSLANHVKATVRRLDRQGKLPPKPRGHEDILDHLAVAIDPHQSLHAMSDLARGFGLVLDQLGFEVLHNKTDISFIASDNPVIYFDPALGEGRVQPYQVRPPHGTIELLFPIDARAMLRGRTGRRGFRHLALNDRSAARRMNRFMARFGYRFVFAADRGHDALVIKHAASSPVLRTTTMADSHGREFISSECVFGPRPVKPKWEGADRGTSEPVAGALDG